MKAIAKHDCTVTATLSLESISLNRMSVEKGHVINLPVHEDKELHDPIARVLGDRTVIFRDGAWFIPTYSRDFNYVEE